MNIRNYRLYQELVQQMYLMDSYIEKLENDDIVPVEELSVQLEKTSIRIGELKSAQQAAGLSCAYSNY